MAEIKNNEILPSWNPSDVERIKEQSDYLRGSLQQSLADIATGSIAADDTQLIKFHGSYQQTDRDLDADRKKQKLEPLYSFMIRVRIPGGVASAQQWLAFDSLSNTYGNNTLKLTTRQAFQFHGVIKRNLKKIMQGINDVLLDSIAACGDVNRNVMCTTNESLSPLVPAAYQMAKDISNHLLPRTTAYHEIWLNQKLLVDGKRDEEPIYGKTYLPRKFKIAIAIPPYNDTDIFSNDIGLIAIGKNDQLEGFNISVGGGLGMTFTEPGTYPRLGDIIGFVPYDNTLEVVEEVVKLQRDYGNRENRKKARLKYTIDRLGPESFKELLEKRLGYKLEDSRPYKFESNGDVFGWKQSSSGKWFLGLFVEHGRVRDEENYQLKSGLRKIASLGKSDFRLTGNQGLVIGGIRDEDKAEIESILKEYKIWPKYKLSGARKHAIACVALNTCTMAFAEAERYLPSLMDKIEVILDENGLTDDDILIRMTGCPNGCGRPYLGEIGFVGRSPGKYNMYLGAGFSGDRLNTLYRETLSEDEILKELKVLLARYAKERNKGERFGDFVSRVGIVGYQSGIKEIK
ncbi:NADPH-dependent assimilatory sulfite reductase hemoprotein subunit [Plebeiibacterium marinum]|uniref:Sulfite reductase [NADPH] hemoprotein beta-component n=1 Tax=Plebeiibacterium marinum TaxID=2992111 RepID=A0AAE3MHB5_9BACT|nr:NADPH-dependent assimilatory sulfite reductase hemoprotein subunit [Plebeiobacterium marinum]MCW3807838.1 NADPH-dependent assimilatory sulfite reductase hemoprotein subunit [Plebeiobacterium marinum]